MFWHVSLVSCLDWDNFRGESQVCDAKHIGVRGVMQNFFYLWSILDGALIHFHPFPTLPLLSRITYRQLDEDNTHHLTLTHFARKRDWSNWIWGNILSNFYRIPNARCYLSIYLPTIHARQMLTPFAQVTCHDNRRPLPPQKHRPPRRILPLRGVLPCRISKPSSWPMHCIERRIHWVNSWP